MQQRVEIGSRAIRDPECGAALLQALDRQRQSRDWKKDNGQFIPYPATWLNREQWKDEDAYPRADRTRSLAQSDAWGLVVDRFLACVSAVPKLLLKLPSPLTVRPK